MDNALLERKFEALGARVKIVPIVPRRWRSERPGPVILDIKSDHRGEFFDLQVDPQRIIDIDAIDVRPRQRHLLLLAWLRPEGHSPPEKPRFLCGHDERHWFVAAIPEAAHASNVLTAMEALKPAEVLAAQSATGIGFEKRFTRRNGAFRRQGEWFFLPRPRLVVPRLAVRKNEPMQRSGGKAHWAEWAYRSGGETVYVSREFPSGLDAAAHAAHVLKHPNDRGKFRIMLRNATLFVKGRISHPDHATILLNEWHEVAMNTENLAAARKNVVFLD
jgi:hypothetical protein